MKRFKNSAVDQKKPVRRSIRHTSFINTSLTSSNPHQDEERHRWEFYVTEWDVEDDKKGQKLVDFMRFYEFFGGLKMKKCEINFNLNSLNLKISKNKFSVQKFWKLI